MQAASFLQRLPSRKGKELGVELLLLQIEMSFFGSWMPPFGDVPGPSTLEEALELNEGIIYPIWPGNASGRKEGLGQLVLTAAP